MIAHATPARPTTIATPDAATLAAAREWLVECFESQEEEINDAPAGAIVREVDRHFDGGWSGFLRGLAPPAAAPAVDPSTVPDIVKARIFGAAYLQATRRRIANRLGVWYVLDERRQPGRQRIRDQAAHKARHWREVARSIGLRPSAVRRAVLATLVAADGRPLDTTGQLVLEPAR